jgi:hypothetical protein
MDNSNTLSPLTIDTQLCSLTNLNKVTPINRIYNKNTTHFSFSSVNRNKSLAKINYNYMLEIKSLKALSLQYVNIINKLKEEHTLYINNIKNKNKLMRNRYSMIINELHLKNIDLINHINQNKNSFCCL